MRAALIAGALLAALAGPVSAGDQVPFRGSLSGSATITPLSPPMIAVELEATGSATHLGRFTLDAPHVVDLGTATGEGTFLFTAANGDTLATDGSGVAVLIESPNVFSISESLTITGGTGRFAGAVGSIEIERVYSFATGLTTGTFEGWISFQRR